MSREHRITHPQLGVITWKQLQKHVTELREKLNRKACWWCFGEVPNRSHTRCKSEECRTSIIRLVYWDECRKVALRAAKFRCELCSASANEVDHIIPVSLGGTGDQDNLRALCSDCHKQETARLRSMGSSYIATRKKRIAA